MVNGVVGQCPDSVNFELPDQVSLNDCFDLVMVTNECKKSHITYGILHGDNEKKCMCNRWDCYYLTYTTEVVNGHYTYEIVQRN